MLVVRGEQQTCHHLFTECRAWLPQTRRLWKDIGKAHGWKHPRVPLGKFTILFEGRWPVAVEGEVYRGGFGLLKKYQGRVHQHQEKASGGER